MVKAQQTDPKYNLVNLLTSRLLLGLTLAGLIYYTPAEKRQELGLAAVALLVKSPLDSGKEKQ